MAIANDLDSVAERLVGMYTEHSSGADQDCHIIHSQEFPGGIKAFILDLDREDKLGANSGHRRSRIIVALLAKEEFLWSSQPTVYSSDKEEISASWALRHCYSKLCRCQRISSNQLKIQVMATEYHNFIDYEVVKKTNDHF